MKKGLGVSRRNFIRQTSVGLGAGIVGMSLPACGSAIPAGNNKMARKVTAASIDLKGLWPEKTRESRIKRVLERMENVKGLRPDIICLPELLDTSWVDEKFVLSDVAEDEKVPGPVTARIAEFAKKTVVT